MSFKTHTEGGSWTGGGTEVPNCNLNERNAITSAFRFLSSNGIPCVDGIGGLGNLAGCLRGKTLESVEIDCRGSNCDGNFGTAPRNGNSINLCGPALPPDGVQADTDVTVFHELIHSCGGMELDSWSLENHCYVGRGTFDPASSVVNGFLDETSDVGDGLRAATFVVWEPATGRVFVKVETGGSWNSSPTISRGNELNVNNAAYMPSGGGGSWI
jgi:hypothetical protein